MEGGKVVQLLEEDKVAQLLEVDKDAQIVDLLYSKRCALLLVYFQASFQVNTQLFLCFTSMHLC